MITVFTPTYNRIATLPRLYESLISQTYTVFEWLIVDDGSTDNTESLIKSYISDGRLSIRYFQQENGGKHRAINRGVKLAKGDLFFIVDSDDYLLPDSLMLLNRYYEEIRNNNAFAGVSGSRCYPDGKRIGGEVSYKVIDSDPVEIRQKWHVEGDMAEAWKTVILKKYPFPEFPGEKFLTEAVVWNEIAKKYKLRYFHEMIYCCEYLDGGLTKNIRRHHRNSPRGTRLFYSSLLHDKRYSLIRHLMDAASYWRYTWKFKDDTRYRLPLWSYLMFPVGVVYYYIDLYNERKSAF